MIFIYFLLMGLNFRIKVGFYKNVRKNIVQGINRNKKRNLKILY